MPQKKGAIQLMHKPEWVYSQQAASAIHNVQALMEWSRDPGERAAITPPWLPRLRQLIVVPGERLPSG